MKSKGAGDGEGCGKSDRFRFVGMVQEDHKKAVYGAQFCYWYKNGGELLATAGANRVSVYECDVKSARSVSPVPLRLLWAAQDDNANEGYYSVAWGVINYHGKRELILAVAGLLGVVRVLSSIGIPRIVFRGHGGAVNELLFHPKVPHILFSASKDHAVRVWDCQNAVCLARLGGVAGHRDEILTLDVILPTVLHDCGPGHFGRLVSGSVDHMVCVWDLDSILKSYSVSTPFKKPILCDFPLFSTLDLHADYVDCCRYLPATGLVASRAAKEDRILLWRPCNVSHKGDIPLEVFAPLEHRQSALWWLKLGADVTGQTLAAGTQSGKISVWRCNTANYAQPALCAASKNNCNGSNPDKVSVPFLMTRFGEDLRHPRCDVPIRQIAVSKNGHRLVAVTDDGRLWRWDVKPPASTATSISNGVEQTSKTTSLTGVTRKPKVSVVKKHLSRGRPSKKSSDAL